MEDENGDAVEWGGVTKVEMIFFIAVESGSQAVWGG
jgi:hypothetical protein